MPLHHLNYDLIQNLFISVQLEETSIAVRMMFFVFSILLITFFLYTGTSVDINTKMNIQ